LIFEKKKLIKKIISFQIFQNPDASEKELREFFRNCYGEVKESIVKKPEAYKGSYDVKSVPPPKVF